MKIEKEMHSVIYRHGFEIKKKLREHNINNFSTMEKIMIITTKEKFIEEYLKICVTISIKTGEFILKVLNDEYDWKEVRTLLGLGILSEETEYLSLQEVAKKLNINDSTLRKAISTCKFNDVECYKENGKWMLSIEAVEREYGKIK